MKMKKNHILALSLALLMTVSILAMSTSIVNADDGTAEDVEGWPVEPKLENNTWYKFETPLITMLFPAHGKKPMFIWWYTNDSSEIYVVKFKGVIEYLTFDTQYYVRRHPAEGLTICERLRERFIGPKMGQLLPHLRERITNRIEYMKLYIATLFGLHPAYLPFSAGSWVLDPPQLVEKENVTYWSFNFTLKSVPMPKFEFAQNNIQIRCRFYNTTATEIIDENHNYTVAAGQLKFDFVVTNWKWNIDKIKPFLEELKEDYGIEVPPHRTGLALWLNLASIKIEDLSDAENDAEYQSDNLVETSSQMRGAMIGDQYCPVTENKTANGEDERPIQLTTQLRERVRISFAKSQTTLAGFLEFVPWARLLNETGDTVEYRNVTASYIAAGAHMRLFLCYPYFGNRTLEHDPTIGLASAPPIPTLIKPALLMILIGATIVIAVAVAAVKLRKKTVNIVNVQ